MTASEVGTIVTLYQSAAFLRYVLTFIFAVIKLYDILHYVGYKFFETKTESHKNKICAQN